MSEEYSIGYARGYEAGQQSVLKLAEQPAQQQEPVRDEALKAWAATYAAFRGAFDSPIARRKNSSEYANDARKRMRDFDERIREALAIEAKLREKNGITKEQT